MRQHLVRKYAGVHALALQPALHVGEARPARCRPPRWPPAPAAWGRAAVGARRAWSLLDRLVIGSCWAEASHASVAGPRGPLERSNGPLSEAPPRVAAGRAAPRPPTGRPEPEPSGRCSAGWRRRSVGEPGLSSRRPAGRRRVPGDVAVAEDQDVGAGEARVGVAARLPALGRAGLVDDGEREAAHVGAGHLGKPRRSSRPSLLPWTPISRPGRPGAVAPRRVERVEQETAPPSRRRGRRRPRGRPRPTPAPAGPGPAVGTCVSASSSSRHAAGRSLGRLPAARTRPRSRSADGMARLTSQSERADGDEDPGSAGGAGPGGERPHGPRGRRWRTCASPPRRPSAP